MKQRNLKIREFLAYALIASLFVSTPFIPRSANASSSTPADSINSFVKTSKNIFQNATQSAVVSVADQSASVGSALNGGLQVVYGYAIDKMADLLAPFFIHIPTNRPSVIVGQFGVPLAEKPANSFLTNITKTANSTNVYQSNQLKTSSQTKIVYLQGNQVSAPSNVLFQNIFARLNSLELGARMNSDQNTSEQINDQKNQNIQYVTNNYNVGGYNVGGGPAYSVPADTSYSRDEAINSAVGASSAALQRQIDGLSFSVANATSTFGYVTATSTSASSTFAGGVEVGGNASIAQNLNVGGGVVATTFYGDGSNLTGITSFSTTTTRNVFSAGANLAYDSSSGIFFFASSTARGMFSSSATGLAYSASTGDFSLASGYVIPTTASTTEWASKVSSQWAANGSDISYSAGNVGIGTTTPAAKLAVEGSGYFNGNISATNGIFTGSGNLIAQNGVRSATSYTMRVEGADGSGLSVSNGGLSIDAGALDFGGGYAGISYGGRDGGYGSNSFLRITGSGGGGGMLDFASASSLSTPSSGYGRIGFLTDHFGFSHGANFNGDVGIGTTTPGSALSVVGSGLFTDNINSGGNVTASAFYGDGSNLTGITSFSTTTTRNVFSAGANLAYDSSSGIFFFASSTARGMFSSSATGLAYSASTGDFSLASGYVIPTTASTTEWASKVSSQWAANGSDISYSAGNVGIGTTTPSAKIHIVGTSPDYGNSGIRFTDTTGTHTYNLGAGIPNVAHTGFSLYDVTAIANRLVVSDSGNIGIGTTNPQQLLHINAASGYATGLAQGGSDGGGIFSAIADTDAYAQLLTYGGSNGGGTWGRTAANYSVLESGGGASNGLIVGTANAKPLMFGTNNAERMRIDSAGNLGIGTTTPYAKLTVVGEAVADNFTAASATATSTFAGGLNVGGGALVHDWSTGVTSIANASLGAMTFESDAGMLSWMDMPVTSASASGTVESYTAQLNGNPLLTIYGLSDGAGNVNGTGVGIGTTTPAYKLAVSGTVGFAGLTGSGATDMNLCINPDTKEVTYGASCIGSSQRFKHDIVSLDSTNGLSLINALRPVSFTYNGNNAKALGFIAEEVNVLQPKLVFFESDGVTPKGVRYDEFAPVLTKAIQELSAIVDGLKAKVDSIMAWFSFGGSQFNVQGNVCVDDVCVTKQQFKQMLLNSGGFGGNPVPVAPVVTPGPVVTPTSTTTATTTDTGTSSAGTGNGASGSGTSTPNATSTPGITAGPVVAPVVTPTPIPASTSTPDVTPAPDPVVTPTPSTAPDVTPTATPTATPDTAFTPAPLTP